MVLIAVTSTLAAVGAASVPMSALVTMITVLQVCDNPHDLAVRICKPEAVSDKID